MRDDTVFKRAFNDMIDLLSEFADGDEMPSEKDLAARLRVSRTTVRKVLSSFAESGLLSPDPPRRKLKAKSATAVPFPIEETVPQSVQVEAKFMQWMLLDDTRPGTMVGELELARKFGVATTVIREFLNRFERFGLIEKRTNTGWIFKGFTSKFADELFEVREMFELRSARHFATLPTDAPIWRELSAIRDEHVALLANIKTRFHDFSELDSRFHLLINSASPNRFVDSFYDILTLIFHYHYQWKKHDEAERNEAAIHEHLAYIDALQSQDLEEVEAACRTHLASARQTLMLSASLRRG